MLINGIVTTNINAADRGLAYGDGLFSTIKIEHGKVIDWPLHLKRLQSGASRLFFPSIDWELLAKEIFESAQTVKQHSHYVLKVILTRGSGGRGYSAAGCDQAVRIISLSHFPDTYLKWQQQGINIIKCDTLLGRNKQLAGLKSLARLEQVFIKQELINLQADEGLVCDELGNVIEGCSANLFIYLNGQWLTPKLDFCGVAGVMRARILQSKLLNITEKDISLDDIEQATCLCLTNALMGVVPVKQYQDKRYSKQALENVAKLQLLLNKEVSNND